MYHPSLPSPLGNLLNFFVFFCFHIHFMCPVFRHPHCLKSRVFAYTYTHTNNFFFKKRLRPFFPPKRSQINMPKSPSPRSHIHFLYIFLTIPCFERFDYLAPEALRFLKKPTSLYSYLTLPPPPPLLPL